MKKEILDILKRATQAWDVAPKGTVEFGVLDKLADEVLGLKEKTKGATKKKKVCNAI